MPEHSDRRETLRWVKIGPPLRGRVMKPAGLRHVDCTGNQPALHSVPCHQAS